MKVFGIALFILAVVAVAPAQTTTATNNHSDLQVLSTNWRYASHQNVMTSAAYQEVAPYTGDDNQHDVILTNRGERIPRYESTGRSNPTLKSARFLGGPQTKGYLYQARVRNSGAKKIMAVKWEYVFTDALDQSVLARHRFYTKFKIKPGKEKTLGGFAIAPPTKVINARAVANNPDQPFIEQVNITRIEYADGSAWERHTK